MLPGNIEEILETLGSKKGHPCSFSFKQRIGGHCGAMGEREDGWERPYHLGHGTIRGGWRRKDFPALDAVSVQGDHIREGSPNVGSDSHVLSHQRFSRPLPPVARAHRDR